MRWLRSKRRSRLCLAGQDEGRGIRSQLLYCPTASLTLEGGDVRGVGPLALVVALPCLLAWTVSSLYTATAEMESNQCQYDEDV